MTDKANFSNDSFDLLIFLYKKRLPIIIITVIGAVASIIVSLTITPMYKSSVILYPTTPVSVSKALLTDNTWGYLAFGKEEDTEQLLQILKSNRIMNHIVYKYNLYEHYEIDVNSKYKLTSMNETYNGNVSINKTKYESINIEVFDTDPLYAANIANDISAFVDTVINEIRKDRSKKALMIIENEYVQLHNKINELSDSIITFNNDGLLGYSQVRGYTDGYAEGISTGKISTQGLRILDDKFDYFEKNLHVFDKISLDVKMNQGRLHHLEKKLAEAKVEYDNDLPFKYIIEEAKPAEKKAKPVRWIIVSMSTIAIFIFSIMLVAFLDFFKKIKIKIKESEY